MEGRDQQTWERSNGLEHFLFKSSKTAISVFFLSLSLFLFQLKGIKFYLLFLDHKAFTQWCML